MTTRHVAVWIDQHEARVFHVEPGSFEESTLRAPRHHLRRKEERGAAERNHPDDAKHFFNDVARALEGAEEILVVGPSTAKLHFQRHLHTHDPKLEAHVVGIETVDHPTDPQIVAYARSYFDRVDRSHETAH